MLAMVESELHPQVRESALDVTYAFDVGDATAGRLFGEDVPAGFERLDHHIGGDRHWCADKHGVEIVLEEIGRRVVPGARWTRLHVVAKFRIRHGDQFQPRVCIYKRRAAKPDPAEADDAHSVRLGRRIHSWLRMAIFRMGAPA